MVRYTVHYSGHVQGVGFRFTARNIARNYNIGGYVQNLPDGRVLVVAEGDEQEVQAFLNELEQAMASFIRNKTVDRSTPTGEFAFHFSIRH